MKKRDQLATTNCTVDCNVLDMRAEAESSRSRARMWGSISGQMIACSGLCGFLAAWGVSHWLSLSDSLWLLVFLGLTAGPMIVLTFFKNQIGVNNPFSQRPAARSGCWLRCWIKFGGLLATLSLLVFCYSLIPIYKSVFYEPAWRVAPVFLISTIAVSVPYFALVDRMAGSSFADGYWNVGLLLHGRFRSVDWSELKRFFLGWSVKGFFLPLMLAGSAEHILFLRQYGINGHSFENLYSTSLNLLFTIDVIFGAIGYLMTFRILDTHIRSVESTFSGWVAAIICYPPLAGMLWSKSLLNYHGKANWLAWLSAYPVLSISWGFCIIFLTGIYAWATCSFGCRFSNLTNRGIITDGPYSILKHPAYVAKNLTWWMIYIPFASNATWTLNLLGTIGLLITNMIYFLRAKTEERHLRADPAYLRYSEWMEEHSLWAHFINGGRRLLGISHERKE